MRNTKKVLRIRNYNVNKHFSKLPIERIEYDGYNQVSEYHICGATRMSIHSDDGVVDKSLVHHKYRNVVVLGSGVFPSRIQVAFIT